MGDPCGFPKGWSPRGGPAVCVAKPVFGSASGCLTRHGENPKRIKKLIFEALVGKAQEVRPGGQNPWSSKCRESCPREQVRWRMVRMFKSQEIKARLGVGVGGITLGISQGA